MENWKDKPIGANAFATFYYLVNTTIIDVYKNRFNIFPDQIKMYLLSIQDKYWQIWRRIINTTDIEDIKKMKNKNPDFISYTLDVMLKARKEIDECANNKKRIILKECKALELEIFAYDIKETKIFKRKKNFNNNPVNNINNNEMEMDIENTENSKDNIQPEETPNGIESSEEESSEINESGEDSIENNDSNDELEEINEDEVEELKENRIENGKSRLHVLKINNSNDYEWIKREIENTTLSLVEAFSVTVKKDKDIYLYYIFIRSKNPLNFPFKGRVDLIYKDTKTRKNKMRKKLKSMGTPVDLLKKKSTMNNNKKK